MVSIVALQAVDPGSIPGRRTFLVCWYFSEREEEKLNTVRKISPKPGLNQRPIAYKAIALPLSY